jgi:chemotaxis response regulator CheB
MQRLLAEADDLEVIVFASDDQAELARAITLMQPDVAILAGEVKVPTGAARLAAIFRSCPDLRVLIVSELDNVICILHRQEMVITETTDLLDLIRRR